MNHIAKISNKYLVTIGVCLAGTLFKIFLIHSIKYPEGGFLISTGTIMISAWYGGIGTGLFATVLNYLIVDWFFITPQALFFQDSFVDQVRIIFFLTEGIFISWLFELLHRSNRKTKEMLQKIFLNEKLTLSLIENIKDYAIFMVDKTGAIRTWNAGATAMTGYRSTEALNKSLAFLLKGKMSTTSPVFLRTALLKKRYKQERQMMRKTSSLFWAEITITALPEGISGEQNFSVIIHDITVRKKIEEVRNEFLSVVSHELRTPVAIMKVILENMLGDSGEKQKTRHIFRKADVLDLQDEINHLGYIVENIVMITRLQVNKFTLHIDRIDISLLTKKIIEKMHFLVKDNVNIKLHTQRKIFVFVDDQRIEQVLVNFLDNAIKFTPKKGKIDISIKKAKSEVIISISNEANEIIPKNKYLSVFNKFYQLSRNPAKGLGLGLYISKRIIEQHKGKVWITTGKATNTFQFSLPIAR